MGIIDAGIAMETKARTGLFLNGALAGAMGLLLLGVIFWNYRQTEWDQFFRVRVLEAQILAGIAAAFCFGGAIYYLNGSMQAESVRPRWSWRMLIDLKLRALMVGQLLATGLAIGAAGLLLFHEPIPHADHSIMFRGWVTPATP